MKEIIMKYFLPLHFYIGNNVNTDKIVLGKEEVENAKSSPMIIESQ